MRLKKLLKNAALICITVMVSQVSFSQISKGKWLVEGNIGSLLSSNSNNTNFTPATNTETSSDSNSFQFFIFPRAGYLITDDLAVGATLTAGFSNGNNSSINNNGVKTNESTSSSSSLGIGPFVRYYFPGRDNLRFYGQLTGSYDLDLSDNFESKSYNGTTGVQNTNSVQNYVSKPSTVGFGGSIGMNYFLTSTVALNTSIGYNISNSKYTTNSTITNFITNTTTTSNDVETTSKRNSFTWGLGFTVFLGGGKSSKE